MAPKAVPVGVGGIALIVVGLALAQSLGTAESLRAPQGESVCLNEFLPRPLDTNEFIELYNRGPEVSLIGWQVGASPNTTCGGVTYKPLTGTLGSGRFLVVQDLPLRDNLGCVQLLRDNKEVDKIVYSSSQSGRSIGRYPDGGSMWRDDLIPSPGGPNVAPTPIPSPEQTATPTRTYTVTRTPTKTRTPTRTLTGTRTPTSTRWAGNTPGPLATSSPTRQLNISVCISEFLPAPGSVVDWDGDGEANYRDEWIELHNASTEDLDLRGWKLDDRAGGGAPPYTFPAGAKILAGEYRAYYLRDTGIALNNSGGDDVRLLAPDGTVVDSVSYEQTAYDVSYSRMGGCTGEWTTALPPSPGQANIIAMPTMAPGLLYLPLIQRPRS